MGKLQSHPNPLQAVPYYSDSLVTLLMAGKTDRQLNHFSHRQRIHGLHKDTIPAQIGCGSADLKVVYFVGDLVDQFNSGISSCILGGHDLHLNFICFNQEASSALRSDRQKLSFALDFDTCFSTMQRDDQILARTRAQVLNLEESDIRKAGRFVSGQIS
jgi:hypothetical protein